MAHIDAWFFPKALESEHHGFLFVNRIAVYFLFLSIRNRKGADESSYALLPRDNRKQDQNMSESALSSSKSKA